MSSMCITILKQINFFLSQFNHVGGSQEITSQTQMGNIYKTDES